MGESDMMASFSRVDGRPAQNSSVVDGKAQAVQIGGMDEADFEQAIAPFRRELRAHCYRMSGSLLDADDLLQETLIKAWKGLPTFEGRSSLRTWLYTVA